MKPIIGKLCLYGILTTVYTTAFFFGALYPRFGIPEEAVVYRENEETKEANDILRNNSDVVYKSYFLEKIKSLKTDDGENRWENRFESK